MEKGGGSRLLQMQAKFQQKQMQERGMKIASLYEAQQTRALDKVRHSPSSNGHVANGHVVSSPPQPPSQAVTHQPGKVRQMFEERRTKGIDKSYPLQPIQNTERTRKALPNGYSKVTATATSNTTSRVTEKRTSKTTTLHSVKKVHHKAESIVNGSGDLNHNHVPDLSSLKHALPQSNGEIMPRDEIDKPDKDNNYLLEDETFPETLAPIPTPRSPDSEPQQAPVKQEVKAPPRRSPPAKSSPAKPKTQPVAAAPRRVTSENAVSETTKPRGAMHRVANPKSQPVVKSSLRGASKTRLNLAPTPASPAHSPAPHGSGDACTVCGRRFAPDRLAKHQDICKKAHAKKRKPFDVLKHRLAGTEAEPFISKLRKSPNNPSTTKVNKSLNSNWRQKHEEFINAIRAAKQVQAHLNAGGKLSDLPPPPPSENPDYVKCPSCGRRFNQSAAERHIPKCKDFQFNKPKPGANSKRR